MNTFKTLNFCVNEGKFPNLLQQANITSPFRKAYRSSKENYCPVSILPVIAKIFEKLLRKQVALFMGEVLSQY